MKQNRDDALTYIELVLEDATLNMGASEPGGASRYGISVLYLSDYNHKHGGPQVGTFEGQSVYATVQNIVDLTEAQARAVYEEMLLDPILFDQLPGGVDFMLAQITANLGTTGGIRALQMALRMWPLTGVMDSDTMARVTAEDPKTLVASLGSVWIGFKSASPNWNPSPVTKNGYGHGWTNRNINAYNHALPLIGGK